MIFNILNIAFSILVILVCYILCWFTILVGGALAGSDAINSWACMFIITKALDLCFSESFGSIVNFLQLK